MFTNNLIAGAAGNQGGFYDFPIEQSLKFNDDDSSYLSWTPASTGDQRTWTFSTWVKRGQLGVERAIFSVGATSPEFALFFHTTDQIRIWADPANTGFYTNAVYRDTSAWYHIVLQSSNVSPYLRLYVNGDEVTSFSYDNRSSNNTGINSTSIHRLGAWYNGSLQYWDGYLAEVNFIDGQALDPTSFGEFKSGVWIPKDPSGLTYGTNGFRLSFQNDTVSEGFNTVLYNGNNSTQSVNGVGFSPDLVWIKDRDTSGANHVLTDSVRGPEKFLISNLTDSEFNIANTLTSFDADGFSLGQTAYDFNISGPYVAWCWDAGSGSPASNTDGSITSTVKANTAYGFSIVSYTGTGSADTVGHGLSSAPEVVLFKRRNAAYGWQFETTAIDGSYDYLFLNSTAAKGDITSKSAPTSSVFSVNADLGTGASGSTYIAYAFHSVANYSDLGSYSGTGSSGNTITTGFKTAFVMIKRTDSTGNWIIFDNTRDTAELSDAFLYPNLSDAEGTSSTKGVEFTDTGFILQNDYGDANASGATYAYIAFADTRDNAFWRDQSGNGNDWQPNNLTYQDSLPDAPNNNFATWNPTVGSTAISEGNLKLDIAGVANSSTIATNEQNVYAEVLLKNQVGSQQYVGVAKHPIPAGTQLGTNTTSWMLIIQGNASNGQPYTNSTTGTSLTTFATGDIAQIAYNPTSGKVWFGKNGTWLNSGDPEAGTGEVFSGISGDISIAAWNASTAGGQMVANFGQDSSFAGNKPAQGNTDDNGVGDFFYAPPSGYLALCSQNLPEPAISPANDDSPSDYFNTVLYTGNATYPRSITGTGFQPDMVFYKSRSSTGAPAIYDAVRGAGAGKMLSTNQASAEGVDSPYTDTDYGFVSSFDSDGFSLDDGAVNGAWVNNSGTTYVAWNWLAGNGTSSNTSGSITSTVSVSETAGFSVVSYTGTGATSSGVTIGHGLGATPAMIITKKRTGGTDYGWSTWHKDLGGNYGLWLNSTAARNPSMWGGYTNINSTVFSPPDLLYGNESGADYINYLFAEIPSYSKFGSFGSTNSTDGPFVFCGFRPALVIYKATDYSANWEMIDATRNPYNVGNARLFPSSSSAENTAETSLDLLSNGFKVRDNYGGLNLSGNHIFMAFAENPFKYANAR